MSTFAVICAAVTVAACGGQLLMDRWVSRQYPLYTSHEKNGLLRAKDGYYSFTRHLILTAIVLGGGFVTAVWFGPWAITAFGGTFAFIMWVQVWTNYDRLKNEKAEQFAILRQIRQDPDNAIEHLGSLDTDATKGIRMFKPFFDIRVLVIEGVNDPKEISMDVAVLVKKIKALAAKPESEWWKLNRAIRL